MPWADMANHDCSAQCCLDWDAPTQTVGFCPDRPYKKGEQARPLRPCRHPHR